MIRTIRYAARQLRKNPTFTLVAVVSVALGIGATSGMFSVADALLFRPLPVPQPANVVHVENCAEGASEFRRLKVETLGNRRLVFLGFHGPAFPSRSWESISHQCGRFKYQLCFR